ncbi:hypothetical protein [Streptomyces coeruleorubidus]|uniref:hypothetical protein n=1 Tax=Streptomyces coeruleorubidus TaxID=116188 RepID=UPI0037A4B5C8
MTNDSTATHGREPLPEAARLRQHVEFLAAEPRSRLRTPRAMQRAEFVEQGNVSTPVG